jgi:glycosyltransferase involved in cell wall biosynthesis
MDIQPYFSVIITTYNRLPLLIRAISSLIGQTEQDWEAIIVDDESTDDTHLRLLPYLRTYDKIRYFRKTHSGDPLSKNTGIWASRGKFITFLDSDDEYEPTHLQSRKNLLVYNPTTEFLYGGAKITGNPNVPDRFNPAVSIDLRNCSIGGTFFIERKVMFALNGFKNILLGADADLFERAQQSQVVMQEANLPTYIYHHETHDSITNLISYNE